MQVARANLPPLDIDLARRKRAVQQAPKLLSNEPASAETPTRNVDPNPPSPLSPPTFLAASPSALLGKEQHPDTEFQLLDERFLLLECVEGAVSPQSHPLRRCVDTVTEEAYFCRECPHSQATSTLLEAHRRLRTSEAVTPVLHVINPFDQDEQGKVYLLSPASYGDLHSYLRVKRRLKEAEARSLFRQAAQAVHDCHERGVILTDLKLRRFVFADPQRTQLRLESLEEAIVLESSRSDDGVWRKHGYPAYVTPEVLLSRGARYSGRAADLWSLGIILYTLLVGRYPFQDAGPLGLFTKIIRGHFTVPDFVSSRARCLIRNLLRRDPAQRLDAADILLHPWFSCALRTSKADQSKSKPDASAWSSSGSIRCAEPMSVDQVVPELVLANSQSMDK